MKTIQACRKGLVALVILMLAAVPALAADVFTSLAEKADALAKAIHGTRSARGMVVNDQVRLENLSLRPQKLADGSFMLRAVDANGTFTSVSHPTLKAQLRDVQNLRFANAESAQASAAAHKGWLTRTANELELSYRGRLGGLQKQLNGVQRDIATNEPAATTTEPAPKPVTENNASAPANTADVAKPVVDNTAPKVSRTRVPRNAANGEGAPAPSEIAQSGTLQAPMAEGTAPALPKPATLPEEPATTGTNTAAKPTTTDTTAKPATTDSAAKPATTGGKPAAEGTSATAPAAPTTMMGKIGASVKNSMKDQLKSLPVMIATGIGVDLARQYRENGNMSLMTAIQNEFTVESVMNIFGAISGGTVGSMVGNVASKFAGPLGPFVKAALTIGGAAIGANMSGGDGKIDWGRLAFSTVLTAGASLIPGVGLPLSIAAGLSSDWLFDKIFGNQKTKAAPARKAKPANTPAPVTPRAVPVPVANGPNNPPGVGPSIPYGPNGVAPYPVAQNPQNPPVYVPPTYPPVYNPPVFLPPNVNKGVPPSPYKGGAQYVAPVVTRGTAKPDSDLYGDLRYTNR